MDITSDTAAARLLAEKKRQIEAEQAGLEVDRARAARDRAKAIEAEREKTERDVVEISQAASTQMDNTKKLNSERVRMLNENTQKHFEEVAAKTASQVKELDAHSLKSINDRRQATMEKLAYVNSQTEDPFYQLKSLNPVVSEGATDYQVKVALPEHEAKNLFVSADGQYLKMSLARRFQENAKNPDADRTTRTNSYQSIVEQISVPGAFEAKGIKREYVDGVVTISVPKAGMPKPVAKNSAVDNYVDPTVKKPGGEAKA